MVRPRRLPPRIAAGEGAGRGRKSRAWEECQKHKTPTECAQFSRQQLKYGDVPKWLKGPHSKCGRPAQTGARVRISPSPPRGHKVRFVTTSFYAHGKKDVIRPLLLKRPPWVDSSCGLGYTKTGRGTFRLPERRIVAERNIGALAGGLRLE